MSPVVRRWLLAGFLSLVLGVVVLFPARVAYHWFGPPGVLLSGIEGSVWSGSATDASVAGIYIPELEWHFRPLALFSGKLGYRILAGPGGDMLETNVAVGFSGTVVLSDLAGSVPISLLQQATGLNGLAGRADIRVESLHLENGLPVSAEGVLDVTNLFVPLVSPAPIGGYRSEITTLDDGINATVVDTDGIVDLAGLFIIRPDRSYNFRGQLAAKPETPARLTEQMRFLGTPNERGQYELRLDGSF